MRISTTHSTTPAAYAGKILCIDLSTGNCRTRSTYDLAERFTGGRGIATKIYWDECRPESRAFDPDNPLIICLGPLAGVPAIGGSRWGIFAKSALGPNHHFSHGNLGGTFGAELKYAGYDGIVVTGKADRPVYISIADNDVALHSAEDLWGMQTQETVERLHSAAAPKSKAVCIGPAGEQLVTYATVFADGGASCSGGMGAVMGAKNLKAIVVRGSERVVKTSDPERIRSIAREIKGYGRGNVKVWGLDFMATGPKTKKLPCAGCMASCLRVKYTAEDGRSGKYMCQSRVFYLPFAIEYYGTENEVPFYANYLCDEYGIDTWIIQEIVEWLSRCWRDGLLTDRESGLPLSEIGSLEFLEALLSGIAYGRGIGRLLSAGLSKAAGDLGPEFAARLKLSDPYDPRYCPVNTLLFPFDTREPIQQLHEAGLMLSQWSSWAQGVEGAHISTQVLRKIAKRFWGSRTAADFTTLEGKAEAALRIQNRQIAKDCLIGCDWMYPVIDNPRGPDHVGDPSFESRILSAATGLDISEDTLYRLGERVFNLQRAVILREGHRPMDDDVLPAEWHEKPLENHVADPQCMVPGSGSRQVPRIGAKIPMKDYLPLREEYYQIRGWDVPSGLPSSQLLLSLDLAEVEADLNSRGLVVPHSRRVRIPQQFSTRLGYLRQRVLQRRLSPVDGQAAVPQMGRDELLSLLNSERDKFADPAIAHNFAGWNKLMRYYITDFGEEYDIQFTDGTASDIRPAPPGAPSAEITYKISSATLRSMATGEISGLKAYQTGKLKISATFADMMKLQSLGKL